MRRSFVKVPHVLLLAVVLLGLWFTMDRWKEINVNEPKQHSPVLIQPKKGALVSRCQEDPSVKNITGFAELPDFIQDFLKYKHCRDFSQILDEPMKCGGRAKSEEVFLLIAIKSPPQNYERRAAIRETWGQETSYEGALVKRVFLSGTSKDQHADRHLTQLLKLESEQFRDILQWDFHDTFYNLTLKQFLFHQWIIENCPGAHFILNGDDDVFINTFNVITYLHDKGVHQHLFVGQLIANVGPIRSPKSKYYIPVQVVSSDSYPAYCCGRAILMSQYTAHVIYNKSLEIPLIPIDDVYLGMCLEKAGLAPKSHMGIGTVEKSMSSFNPCIYRQLIMVHGFVPTDMRIMWKALQDPNFDCGQKLSVYNGRWS